MVTCSAMSISWCSLRTFSTKSPPSSPTTTMPSPTTTTTITATTIADCMAAMTMTSNKLSRGQNGCRRSTRSGFGIHSITPTTTTCSTPTATGTGTGPSLSSRNGKAVHAATTMGLLSSPITSTTATRAVLYSGIGSRPWWWITRSCRPRNSSSGNSRRSSQAWTATRSTRSSRPPPRTWLAAIPIWIVLTPLHSRSRAGWWTTPTKANYWPMQTIARIPSVHIKYSACGPNPCARTPALRSSMWSMAKLLSPLIRHFWSSPTWSSRTYSRKYQAILRMVSVTDRCLLWSANKRPSRFRCLTTCRRTSSPSREHCYSLKSTYLVATNTSMMIYLAGMSPTWPSSTKWAECSGRELSMWREWISVRTLWLVRDAWTWRTSSILPMIKLSLSTLYRHQSNKFCLTKTKPNSKCRGT